MILERKKEKPQEGGGEETKRRILGSLTMALAIATRCFWPPESWEPLSPTKVSYPLGRPTIKLWALAFLAAAIISSSVAPSFPNAMFSLMLLANKTGSWLTTPI